MKAALAEEQSEENFRAMIQVCHYIIEYHWHEAKNMDEFADLVQSYEKTAVSFWKKYKTLESLYHIVYFYGDWMFTAWIYGLREPVRNLEHMKKGVLYAQLYHEKANKDYSAAGEDVCSFPLESQKEALREEWKLFEKMDRMRREALSGSEELFAVHRKEIYHCIRTCMHLQRTAHDKGLKPLLLEGKKLEKSGRIYCGLLSYGIKIIGEPEHQHITERMMERFGRETEKDAYAKYMAYLCTRFLEMVYKGQHTPAMQAFLLSCVPPGERSALLKYLEYQTV